MSVECELCHGDSELDPVRQVRWGRDGVISICSTCRENHGGEWSPLEDDPDFEASMREWAEEEPSCPHGHGELTWGACLTCTPDALDREGHALAHDGKEE